MLYPFLASEFYSPTLRYAHLALMHTLILLPIPSTGRKVDDLLSFGGSSGASTGSQAAAAAPKQEKKAEAPAAKKEEPKKEGNLFI